VTADGKMCGGAVAHTATPTVHCYRLPRLRRLRELRCSMTFVHCTLTPLLLALLAP
jgi:hypothetical protein